MRRHSLNSEELKQGRGQAGPSPTARKGRRSNNPNAPPSLRRNFSNNAAANSVRRTFSGMFQPTEGSANGGMRRTFSGMFHQSNTPASEARRGNSNFSRDFSLRMLINKPTIPSKEAIENDTKVPGMDDSSDTTMSMSGSQLGGSVRQRLERCVPRRTKSARPAPTTRRAPVLDEEKAFKDMEDLSRDLERMARLLGKVDDPQRLMLKHMKQQSARNCAA